MGNKPLIPNGKYAVKHTTNDVRCMIKNIQYKMDINTLHRIKDDKNIKMNNIARVMIRTTKPLLTDRYTRNRNMESLILVDEATNETVGAGMIV